MKHRGKPIITLRLDASIIAALRISARQRGETVSDLLRDLIEDHLREAGVSAIPRPIDGQIHI